MEADMEPVAPWVDKLNTLASADEVAKFLEEEGVTGWPMAAHHCAISMFLRGKTGKTVSTIPELVSTWEENPDDREQVALAPPVNDFIARFDAQKYPQLIRRVSIRSRD